MNRIGLFIWITAIGVSSPGAVELVAPGGEPGKGKGKALNVRPRMTHEQLARLQRPRDPKLKGQTVRLSDLQQRNLREDSEASTKAAKRRESLVKRSTIVSGARVSQSAVETASIDIQSSHVTKSATRTATIGAYHQCYAHGTVRVVHFRHGNSTHGGMDINTGFYQKLGRMRC